MLTMRRAPLPFWYSRSCRHVRARPDAASHLDRVCAAPTASPTTPTPSSMGDTNPPTSLSTSAPTYMPTRSPTLTDGIPYQLPRDLRAAHARPNRPGPSVQEGPLRGASWAAANVPPTTFASSTRAPVGARPQPRARPMIGAWPTLTTHKAALCPSPLPCPSPLLCTTTSWVQPAPVSHSQSCCAPVRAFPCTPVEGASQLLARLRVESL